MKYPLARPQIGKEEEKAVLDVLRSGVLSLGPAADAFEREFASFVGTRYAVAVSSGTAGLHLALLAAGIGAGDEVITSPFSFVASANAILYVGAKPVFVDINPLSYNIDPEKIVEKITARTKAILPVHMFGQCADMAPILEIAKRHKLKVIEDACESIGAVYERGGKGGKRKMAGTFGESGVFAFYPNKQMTTGEGGMIVTNEIHVAQLCRSLRNQGRALDARWLNHERLGYNYRMDEMSAALGRVQLRRLPSFLRARRTIVRQYEAELAAYQDLIEPPRLSPESTHSWFLYAVRLPRHVSRTKVIERLRKQGIASKPYVPSIHLFGFYRAQFGYAEGDFPVSEEASARLLALPLYVGLTRSDISVIIRALSHALHEE